MKKLSKDGQRFVGLIVMVAGLTGLLVLTGYSHNQMWSPVLHVDGEAKAIVPPVPGRVVPPEGYDICLQDDKTNDVLLINSVTGDYKFIECSTGVFPPPDKKITFEGKGKIEKVGDCTFTVQTFTLSDSRVKATVKRRCVTACWGSGSATVFVSGRPGRSFRINDKNTCDNTCSCANGITVSFTGTGEYLTSCSNLSGIFDFNVSAVFPADYVRGDGFKPIRAEGTATLYKVNGETFERLPLSIIDGSIPPDDTSPPSPNTRVDLRGTVIIEGNTFNMRITGTSPNGKKGTMSTLTCPGSGVRQ